MQLPSTQCGTSHRLVGDPIDVVTGANLDSATDLYLIGPIPLEFRRYYNSGNCEQQCSLGWGHAHEFEQRLTFDLDGIRYEFPDGGFIEFQPVEIGAEDVVAGFVLTHPDEKHYELTSAGLTTKFRVVDSKQALLRQIRRGNHKIEFRYSGENQLRQIDDSAGRKLLFAYYPNNLVKSIAWTNHGEGLEDEPKVLLSYQYDVNGNLCEAIDAYGNSFSWEFNSKHQMIRKTDRLGHSFLYEYDSLGRCVHSRGSDGLHEVNMNYMPEHSGTEVTRGDGGNWLYIHENGAITEIIDPYGGKTSFTIDDEGRVAVEVGPGGSTKKWVYGTNGELLGKRTSLGQFIAVGEDEVKPKPPSAPVAANAGQWEFGELVSVEADEQARAEKTHLEYTLGEKPDQLFDFDEVESTNGFLKTKDGRTFDHFGNLVKQENELGQIRRWAYDANGNVTRYIDRDGSTYSFEYDSWNIICAYIDPLGNRTTAKVNGERFRSNLADPGGHSHDFVYDHKDRLTEVRRFDRVKESYQYDHAGNLTKKIDTSGTVLLEQEFDRDNLVLSRKVGDGKTYQYGYNDWGQVETVQCQNEVLELGHLSTGFRTKDLRNEIGVVHEVGPDRITQSSVLDQFVTKYDLDDDYNWVVTDPTGASHVFAQDHRKIEKRLNNGTVESTQFDSQGRCVSKSHQRDNQIWNRGYKYSGEGYLDEVTDDRNGNTTYVHDAAHRLRQSIKGKEKERFEYDVADNLVRKPGLLGVVISDGNRLRQANGEAFEYNDRNAITRRSNHHRTLTYRYDSQVRLVAIENDETGIDWSCEYDVFSRRTQKTYGDRTTQFIWDNDRLAAEVRHNGSVRVYVYADSLSLTPFMFVDYESQFADPAEGRRYYVTSNHQSAPVRIENELGEVVWECEHDPYGQCEFKVELIQFNLRQPGHYHDPETGLNYNRHRQYDPEIGRYLQADPSGLGGGRNLYAYCHNPLVEVDLFGLAPDHCGGTKKTDADADAESAARRARIAELSEANYGRLVRKLEAEHGTPNVHSVEKHGAQTTLGAQRRRVQDAGYPNPTTGANGNATKTASKFRSNKDHYDTLRRALDLQEAEGFQPQRRIEFERPIGDVVRNEGTHSNRGPFSTTESSTGLVRFDPTSQKFYTAYPEP
ncbi:MAG: RHS repeat-associated core domain-containing protein [Mariniblastus sp.]